jgi:hypothetical protein
MQHPDIATMPNKLSVMYGAESKHTGDQRRVQRLHGRISIQVQSWGHHALPPRRRIGRQRGVDLALVRGSEGQRRLNLAKRHLHGKSSVFPWQIIRPASGFRHSHVV